MSDEEIKRQAQTMLYNKLMSGGNSIGRMSSSTASSNTDDNFFAKRGRSIENALGTTGAAIASAIKSGGILGKGTENIDTENMLKDNQARMNDIAKKYGYSTYHDVWDARDKAEAEGDTATLDLIDNTINPELQAQANANAKKADEKAAAYKDYVDNNYVSQKINQDRGKFAGSAINTLSTAADLTGVTSGPLSNAIQGGIEGVADELEQNGFENFDAERAAQNALIGATTGAVTGALNKGMSSALAKNGGNLFKGGNALTRGLNNLGSKTAVGRVGSTLATGAARGAASGAVGGATGAGLSSALNGVEFGQGVQNALQGAAQGAKQGAVSGATMAGANMAISKTPGVGEFYNELQGAKQKWDQSGENFDERLTNTLTSGDSAVGDWLMKERQSKLLGAMGNIGNTVKDVSDDTSDDIIEEMARNRNALARLGGERNKKKVYRGNPLNKTARKTVDDTTKYNNELLTERATELGLDSPLDVEQGVFYEDNPELIKTLVDEGKITPDYDWDGQEHSVEYSFTDKMTPSDRVAFAKMLQDDYGVGADRIALLDESLTRDQLRLVDQDGYNKAPTNAKGWAKKAGQRIVEDVNNTNLGNRIVNVNGQDVNTDKILKAYGDEYNRLYNMEMGGHGSPDMKNGVDYFDNVVMKDPALKNLVNELVAEQQDYFSSDREAAALANVLKKQGIGIDMPKNSERTLPANTGDKQARNYEDDNWNRIANEGGYASYDDAVENFKLANPGVKVGENDASKILTWIDENPGNANTNVATPETSFRTGQNKSNIVAEDPSKQVYNALAGDKNVDADVVPSKTSKEGKMRYARGKELLLQYGPVDQPTARSSRAIESIQEIADAGFTKPEDVEKMANVITGSNGEVSKLTRNLIRSAAPVNTFEGRDGETIEDFVDRSIDLNSLSGTNKGNAVKQAISANLRSLPSRAEGSVDYTDAPEDVFKVVQNLEASAAELEGRGGSTYHRPTIENIHQAAVLKDTAGLLKERLFDGADVESALTPEVAQNLKSYDPGNEKYADWVDNTVMKAKSINDLRKIQAPYVRMSKYIDNAYTQAATVGGRMANASDLSRVLTTKNGLLRAGIDAVWNSNAARRGRAAIYDRMADKAAGSAPETGAVDISTKAIPTNNVANLAVATGRTPGDDGTTPAGDGTVVSTPAQLASATTNYNPATQIYNAIGRTEGLTNAEQARAAGYITDAVQEAEVVPNTNATNVSLLTGADAINGAYYPDANTTSVYNSVYGMPTATQTSTTTAQTGYFQPTGDYWTDILASALSSAINDRDLDAFTTLYDMYQDSVAKLQKQEISSTSQQKLTDKQRQANAAERALNDFELAEHNFAYDVSDIPVIGGIANFGGNDYLSKAEALAVQIGYMLSGAQINKEEAKKIGTAYVPQPRDNEAVRQSKLAQLRGIISDYQQTYSE